jgi:hypothetical protein
LEEVLEVLSAEMNLPFNVPGGMASYRKTLALSFFFKLWNTVGSEINLSPDLLPSKVSVNVAAAVEMDGIVSWVSHVDLPN